jgi:hypothetical protein
MIPLLREERENSQAIGALLVKLSVAAYYRRLLLIKFLTPNL